MTTINVSNATQLNNAISTAKAGDTISLASGNYGEVWISKAFAAGGVTITSQTAGGAVFDKLSVVGASNLTVDAVSVKQIPTATTYTWTPAVDIRDSSNITISHSTITGGNAVSGITQDGKGLDVGGNVQGMPTGYGVSIQTSSGIKIDSDNISQFYKGVVLYKADYVTVSNNDVHDTRTTSIVAGGGSHITIDSNHLHDVNPYHFGPDGDHADYLAMWTNDGQTAASTDIKVTNNLMEQGKGQAVLGMWLQGGSAGYTNVQISGNAILAGNAQGIVLSEVTGGSIDHNTLLQTSGTTKDSAPGILLAVGSEKISVHDNVGAYYQDTSGSKSTLANTFADNTTVQKLDASKAGYYTNDLIVKAEATHDLSGLYSTTTTDHVASTANSVASSSSSSSASTAAVTTPVVTAPVVTAPVVTAPVVTTPAPVVNMTINGTWDWQKLVGGAGNDVFNSKTTGDTLVGGAGDDTYYVVGNSKTLVVELAGGGTDTVISKGDYTLTDNVENLTLAPASDNWGATGNSLNNVILGNAGGNFLYGMDGNDTINGGAGADYITGGRGDDLLIGGAGKDTFRFSMGDGKDVISDFSKGDHDAIDISAFMKAGYKAVLTDVGGDVKISFAGLSDTITLTGVHAKDLVADWYGFTA